MAFRLSFHSNLKSGTMKTPLSLAPCRHERIYSLRTPSAIGKKSILNIDCKSLQPNSWRQKSVVSWLPLDVAHWISSVADDSCFSIDNIDMTRFKVCGAQLAAMSENEFALGNAQFGHILFKALRLLVQTDVHAALPEPKKRRGRPVTNVQVRREPKKRLRLWEFLLQLLCDPNYCPSVLEWEKWEVGSFRIKQSEKLAKMWGERHGRSNMDYVKLSRLMRYYYKQKALIADKQRLVYRFGPNADGWKTKSQESSWSKETSVLSLQT